MDSESNIDKTDKLALWKWRIRSSELDLWPNNNLFFASILWWIWLFLYLFSEVIIFFREPGGDAKKIWDPINWNSWCFPGLFRITQPLTKTLNIEIEGRDRSQFISPSTYLEEYIINTRNIRFTVIPRCWRTTAWDQCGRC